MKNNPPPRVVSRSGITLIELTVVIVVLIMLITVVSFGASAWRKSSDRATCVMNLRNMQVAARSYQNLHGYYFGSQARLEYGTQDIARHLLEKDYISRGLYDQSKGARPCAGGGKYTTTAPEIFPLPGDLFMTCSLASTEEHMPDKSANW